MGTVQSPILTETEEKLERFIQLKHNKHATVGSKSLAQFSFCMFQIQVNKKMKKTYHGPEQL
jgi:hypothetical protein